MDNIILSDKLKEVYIDVTHINTEMDFDEFLNKILNICFPVNKCCENGECPHCQSIL